MIQNPDICENVKWSIGESRFDLGKFDEIWGPSYPDAPVVWNIDLHLPYNYKSSSFVGDSGTMEHLILFQWSITPLGPGPLAQLPQQGTSRSQQGAIGHCTDAG